MNSKRINRISEEVKRTISDIVQNELKDPRIPSITSISHVEVTNDLSYAKVCLLYTSDAADDLTTV